MTDVYGSFARRAVASSASSFPGGERFADREEANGVGEKRFDETEREFSDDAPAHESAKS